MKTIEELKRELKELVPTFVDLMLEDPSIGTAWYCEEGFDSDPASNYICYEKDGWTIDISYELCGIPYFRAATYWEPEENGWQKTWGEVTEIIAGYYDEDEDKEVLIEDEEFLAELTREIEAELKNFDC